jgi:hypothetical protein
MTMAIGMTIGGTNQEAMVVPSPAIYEVFEATSRTICAPMFSADQQDHRNKHQCRSRQGKIGRFDYDIGNNIASGHNNLLQIT